MARPSILNEALITEFCKIVVVSSSIETAIKITGIGRETYYGWARKVHAGAGSALQKKFIVAVDKAEGQIKLLYEQRLMTVAKNWQRYAWWLERRHPNEYGQRYPAPVTDDDPAKREVSRIVWRKADKPAPALQPADSNQIELEEQQAASDSSSSAEGPKPEADNPEAEPEY